MMLLSKALLLAFGSLAAAETIVGVYMFHRHGDRTAKALPPTSLTDLGYRQVYESGQYYHDRYITSGSSTQIYGISSSIVNEGQILVSAPLDTVLQNSAMGFLQGLYPAVGDQASAQVLRNGTTVDPPLNGYQLIPVDIVSTGAGSENNAWLQSASSCANAEISSNQYFYSTPYTELYNSTMDFYHSINPVINGTFNMSTTNFKNAYTIWDLINVAEIHNQTINSSSLITNATFHQLYTLANNHEFNLAYNASSTIRAVGGMALAGQILQFLNTTITSKGSNKLGIQFGAYGTFTSFFGLADLLAADPIFYGICDYASSMSIELFTPTTLSNTSTSFPAAEDLSVRFLWHNGTASAGSPPQVYPLFGQSNTTISWPAFVAGLNKFALNTQEDWCVACGNTTGSCAPYASEATPAAASCSGSGGMSNAVAGVIGAFVTLVVVLGIELLVMLIAGLRLVRKKRLLAARHTAAGGDVVAKG